MADVVVCNNCAVQFILQCQSLDKYVQVNYLGKDFKSDTDPFAQACIFVSLCTMLKRVKP